MHKLDHWENWAPAPDTPPTTALSTPETSARTTSATPVPSLHLMSMVDEETSGMIREVLALVGVITCVIIWSALMRLVKWGRRKVRYCFFKFI